MKENILFDWDGKKAAANAKKHGVTFEHAKQIWDDPFYYRVKVAGDPEERWLVVGRIGRNAYLSAIVTYRRDVVRIISARRSTKMEVQRYHG